MSARAKEEARAYRDLNGPLAPAGGGPALKVGRKARGIIAAGTDGKETNGRWACSQGELHD